MIRFSKYIRLYALISALVLIPGIYSLIRFGLKPSIDFTGGTLVEFSLAGTTSEAIAEEAGGAGLGVVSIQSSPGDTYLVRARPEGSGSVENFLLRLQGTSSASAVILRNETVGPTLGRELLEKTVTAAVIAVCVILLYVAYAFKNFRFGISAVFALLHDVLVVFGIFSLLGVVWGVEVDTLFVTAFLTTMSFSVHDTIVVFDRIREYTKRGEKLGFEETCDRALTETMGRSLANSFTIVFMLVALILLGGGTIRWFAVALLVGTVSGTYSSPFVATPILILWKRWEAKRQK
jgi:preprotein translocase subunit SecF